MQSLQSRRWSGAARASLGQPGAAASIKEQAEEGALKREAVPVRPRPERARASLERLGAAASTTEQAEEGALMLVVLVRPRPERLSEVAGASLGQPGAAAPTTKRAEEGALMLEVLARLRQHLRAEPPLLEPVVVAI